MRTRVLRWLRCPDCGAALALEGAPVSEDAKIESGRLACGGCARAFPIEGHVPRLVGGLDDARVLKTRESFGWEWLRYPGALPEDRGIFLEETQLPAEAWAGKLVLDAGCGMGRYARQALALGAEVVAMDLSESLLRLVPDALDNPRLHVVQGDLLRPPLAAGTFDIAYSQGVLHHTADTRAAFEKVAGRVKPGGHLAVWVYGTPGPYSSFASNPLKASRAWIRRLLPLIWAGVWLRQLASDALRLITTRLSVPLLYAACYPLAWLGALAGLKYLSFSVHPDFKVRLIENFDWLSPPFQTKHTKEELGEWFAACGFEPLRRLPHGIVPKPGLLGRKT